MEADVRNIFVPEYGQTDIVALTLIFTLGMGLLLLRLPRSRALLPFLIVCSFLPVAQRLVIASLDFNMIRILIVFGIARVMLRGEGRFIHWTRLDTVFCTWVVAGMLIHTLRLGTLAAFVSRLGLAFDACGLYFLCRAFISDATHIERSIRDLAWITPVIGLAMGIEFATTYNVFAIFGGVSETTAIRGEHVRSLGAFSHPIMAGTYGAALAPLFLGLGLRRQRLRPLAIAGLLGAFAMVVFSSSSGPVVAFAIGLGFWALWPFRIYLTPLRWCVVFGLLALQLVMEKPIWHLILRLGNLLGGTGYHRYRLIDAFVENFGDWWLIGTEKVAYWGWGLQDVTNQFVLEGVRGGLLGLCLFVAILVLAFRSIGSTVRRTRACRHLSGPERLVFCHLTWALGVSLAVHVVSFISVSYFGQMQALLYLLLGTIASLESVPQLRAPTPSQQRVQSREPVLSPVR